MKEGCVTEFHLGVTESEKRKEKKRSFKKMQPIISRDWACLRLTWRPSA